MDKLVKRLRNCAELHGECALCLYQGNGCDTMPETPLIQAADAIEELSKLADEIPHVCECCIGCELEKKNGGCDHAFVLSPKRAAEYLLPRWIPVTERLPREMEIVLVTDGKNVGWSFCVNDYGTMEFYSAWTITHWMPLPEPPEEE